MSVSQPFVAFPSQSPNPALQVKPQEDDVQVLAAFARAGQTTLHPPQFERSVVVFAQMLPQRVGVVPPQEMVQLPLEHTSPITQERPHIPQWVVEERVSTSHPLAGFPSQFAKFAVHDITRHTLPVHVEVALSSVHMAPHALQLLASEAVSTQLPAHGTRPAGHAHELPWQVRPPVQEFPQRPQFASSVRRSRSHPFEAFPSQLPKPVLQVKPHVEAAQVATAFERAGQTFPQAPQCAGLDTVFVQAPMQSVGVSPAQETTHTAPEHTWPEGHGFTQRPQLP